MEMEKKKKDYEAPDIKVTQVEIENSICSGSGEEVKFGDQNEGITISDQTITDTKNDFSEEVWSNN